MIFLLRGILLSIVCMVISVSAVTVAFILENNLFRMSQIYLYTALFVLILSLIICYPFFKLCDQTVIILKHHIETRKSFGGYRERFK